jgi:hypothetical protein
MSDYDRRNYLQQTRVTDIVVNTTAVEIIETVETITPETGTESRRLLFDVAAATNITVLLTSRNALQMENLNP